MLRKQLISFFHIIEKSFIPNFSFIIYERDLIPSISLVTAWSDRPEDCQWIRIGEYDPFICYYVEFSTLTKSSSNNLLFETM